MGEKFPDGKHNKRRAILYHPAHKIVLFEKLLTLNKASTQNQLLFLRSIKNPKNFIILDFLIS